MTQGCCTDKTALIGFLYDDCEPGEREIIATHVADCADCTAELASLSATRRQLAAWVPPHAALGFQIDAAQMAESLKASPRLAVIEGGNRDGDAPRPALVADRPPLGTTSWWRQPLPAWAQAAAAVLIFAAGVGFGAGRTGATGTTGDPTQPPSAARVASPAVRPTPVAATERAAIGPDDLARLEEKLRAMQAEIAAVRASSGRTGQASETDPAPSFAQVRDLVADSELRLQGQLVVLDKAVQGYVQQIGNMLDPAQRARAQEFYPIDRVGFSRPAAIGLTRTASHTR
jgi:hypothetical protein